MTHTCYYCKDKATRWIDTSSWDDIETNRMYLCKEHYRLRNMSIEELGKELKPLS